MRDRLSFAVLVLQPLVVLVVLLGAVAFLLSSGWDIAAFVVFVMIALDVVAGVRGVRRARVEAAKSEDSTNLPVITREAGHERLWALVDEVATAAKVQPPARIVLSMSVTAAVGPVGASADVDGRGPSGYELVLGPNLVTLGNVAHLRAILAHELGHVAAGPVSPDAAARFAIAWAEPFYVALPPGLAKMACWLHFRAWLPVAAWAQRPAERRADSLAFRLAGPRTTAEALVWTSRLDAAEEVVTQYYLPLAVRARRRPLIHEAVREVLASSEHELMDEVLESREPSLVDRVHNSHPTDTERVAAAQAAAARGVGVDADRSSAGLSELPAADLLDGGLQWLSDREVDQVNDGSLLRGLPVSDWAEVIDLGARALIGDDAHDLADTAATPADSRGRRLAPDAGVPAALDVPVDQVSARLLLDAADRVGLAGVLHDPKISEEDRLSALSVVSARALDRAGRIRVVPVWGAPATFAYFDGHSWSALRSLVGASADPSAEQREPSPLDAVLRRVAAGVASVRVLADALARAGADLDAPLGLTADERQARPGYVLGMHAGGTVRRGQTKLDGDWVAVVTTSGVWLVPEPDWPRWQLTYEREAAQREFMGRLGEEFDLAGAPDLHEWPDSLWISETALAQVRVAGVAKLRVELVGNDGEITGLTLPATAPTLGDVANRALVIMAGNRSLLS
jgi:Zn-dependent protease with chaperone function